MYIDPTFMPKEMLRAIEKKREEGKCEFTTNKSKAIMKLEIAKNNLKVISENSEKAKKALNMVEEVLFELIEDRSKSFNKK